MTKRKKLVAMLLALQVMGVQVNAEIAEPANQMLPYLQYDDASITGVQPCYEYTQNVLAYLTINGGQAVCSGYVLPNTQCDATVSVALYKQTGDTWRVVAFWSGSATGGKRAIAGGTVTVEHGTYKVVTVGNVSNLEYPKAECIKTY